MQRKKELSPMISEFIFYEEDAAIEEKNNYINLKVEIRQLIKNDFNRKILSEVLLDLQKDVSGDTQKRLFKLYQDLNLHTDAFAKLKSWRWEVVSKAITDLTQMQVSEAYGFVTKFINDKRATIRKQAELATVTLKHEGLNFFLDTTTYKISEWQQLKVLDITRNQKDYQPPRFKAWLTSTNSYVVLFALRLIKFYQQNDANASLIELVKHKNNQIKQEAIDCIKEFHIVEALDTLKTIFWNSTTDVKISILDTIGIIGEEKDIEFLQLIENKESNFYVKSKALSSINAIAPESIMPSKGILDTSNFQIPDDLPIEDQIINTTIKEKANTLTIKVNDKPSVEKENIDKEELSSLKDTTSDKLEQNQVLEKPKVESIDLNFLPLVVAKTPEQSLKKDANYINNERIKNMSVNFEEIAHFDPVKDTYASFLKESNDQAAHKGLENSNPEEIAFLPIVVDSINEKASEIIIHEVSQNSSSLRSIEVEFEIVEKLTTKEVKKEFVVLQKVKEENFSIDISSSKLTLFDQYQSKAIFNLDVVCEVVFIELTIEERINNIEVIEPHFLSISSKDSKEKLMDDISNINTVTPPLQKEMNAQDEVKFRKIINDLIDFENKEAVNEIIEEFQDSSLLEFENEFENIEFIPLVEEKKEETNVIEEDNPSHKVDEDKKESEVNIPSTVLTDDLLEVSDLPDMSPEESTMQLLDDLSEMGDHREVPLLKEMLENEKYVTVKERIKKLILIFSNDTIEAKPTKKVDTIELKAFNVFEDLFRNCDTESKLILLDEIVAIGDLSDIEFLVGLQDDNEGVIQNKAADVLKKLRFKLAEKNEPTSICSEQNSKTGSTSISSSMIESFEKDKTQSTYTELLETLEINPSSSSDDIFDLLFEITANDDINEQETFKKSVIGQLYHFSNKFIEKLNG